MNRCCKASSLREELKMLTSSDQKVRGQDRGCDLAPAWTLPLRRIDDSYGAQVLKVNLVTLSAPLRRESEPRGEPMGGQREDSR